MESLLKRHANEIIPGETHNHGNSIRDCCQAEVEDLFHALWTCTELDMVWIDQALWEFRNSVGFADFKDLVSWIIAGG